MNHRISRDVYRKLMISFWRSLLTYMLCIFGAAAAAYLFLRRRIWHQWDWGYPFLHWLNTHILSVGIACILAGGVFIILFYFYRMARMMEEITDAVGVVYQGWEKDPVALPEVLHEVEMQLNQIMATARENQYQMERVQRQKDDMIMYMAHDLKTPLTSVLGYLTLLQDEEGISEQTRKHYLDIALKKAYRLEDLINEFFDMTRIGYSEIILTRTNINLSRMLEQLLFEFSAVFEEKDLSYSLECPEELIVSCDVEQMQRVFENLFKNVANYSYPGSSMQVVLKQIDPETCLCMVRNHGKTIPVEKLAHIFDQFYRIDSARESRTGGTGLGLAIVKQIIELHQGEIICTSENEVITFRFTLPMGGH